MRNVRLSKKELKKNKKHLKEILIIIRQLGLGINQIVLYNYDSKLYTKKS